jgi:enoyl-CoA hydratase
MHVERAGDVVVWTIDRPGAKNALDLATMEALRLAVEAAGNDRTVRAAVLTGAGDVFVSGGDLRELRGRDSRADAEVLSDAGHALTTAIAALPVPVIAALNGAAIGGGAELAVACDIRVASASARLSFKQARMGVTTAWGTVPRLLRLIGRGAAARLLLTAQDIGARDAMAMGLVDAVVDDPRATALEWAQDVARGAPEAIASLKRLLDQPEREVERELFVDTWSSPDHREALEAYFERRPARWSMRR